MAVVLILNFTGNCMMKNKVLLAGSFTKYLRLFSVMFFAALTSSSIASSIPALNLRSTSSFVILAGSTVTGIPPVSIKGNVGLSPAAGSLIVGFDGSNVDGILYVVDATGPAGSVQNASLLQTAKSDLTIAYNDAAGRTPVPTGSFLNPGGGNIGGLNLVPGLYKFTSSAAITGSDVTLTGSATDVWIFQIGSSLNLGSGIKVILAGGAKAANIFWQVGTSATLGTFSSFKGTILADQSISLGTGASLDGRALAFGAAVTISSGVTTNRSDLTFPIFSVNPTSLDFGNVANGQNKSDSVTVTNTGGADLIITSVTSNNTVFSVTPGNVNIVPGNSKKFYISFAPNSNNLRSGYIVFNHNDAGGKDSVSVKGTGTSPVFSANPQNINFGIVSTGSSKMDTVTVTNTGTSNLIISNVTSSNTLFTVNSTNGTITPGQNKKFIVTFAPVTAGLKTGYIYFTHNASNLKDSIIVSGLGGTSGNQPEFSTNTNFIDFGALLIGTQKQLSVIVTNTGNADLIISEVVSNYSQYTVSPSSGTISPGLTKEFVITFSPIAVDEVNAQIQFTHNAGIDIVNVIGRGVTVVHISDAKQLPYGTEFVTEGIVTRALGSYTRIQDETGALTIVQTSGEFFEAVANAEIKMTDKIRIQGKLSELNFLTVVNGSDLTTFERISRSNTLPTPMKITLKDIADNGENYESRLITVENLTILNDGGNTFRASTLYQTTDASDMSKSVDISIGSSQDSYMAGMPYFETGTFVGVLGQSSMMTPESGYQLTPVLQTDLFFVPTSVVDNEYSNGFTLSENYPNPFTSSTTIQYSLVNSDYVTLKVTDVLGNVVATLVNGFVEAGNHSVSFSAGDSLKNLAGGVYFYTLQSDKFSIVRKFIIVE